MPELTVSRDLYRQIQSESADGDVEKILWEMVGTYRRQHNSEPSPAR